jgi:ABC-type maltose transport system permease subunit
MPVVSHARIVDRILWVELLPIEHNIHRLCPNILAVGRPNSDFSFAWIAYKEPEGWPLASNWHQLKEDIRAQVVHNLATFVRGLANMNVPPAETKVADYVGSTSDSRVLVPPILTPVSNYCLGYSDLESLDNYRNLVDALIDKQAHVLLSDESITGSNKSLLIQQLEAIRPVVLAILGRGYSNVLAHLNLTPQNIWIDPFNGSITAIFGWEYAHFAPVWMATAPLPWLLDEKMDLVLAGEKSCDPWMVWRPSFHHPPRNTAREMRSLRIIWETAIRSEIGDHLFSQTTFASDELYRTALRVCFVEPEKLGDSVKWAREVVTQFLPWWRHTRVLALMVCAALIAICAIAARHNFSSLFGRNDVLAGGLLLVVVALSAMFVLPSRGRPLQRFNKGGILFDTTTAAHFMSLLDPVSIKTKLFYLSKGEKTKNELGPRESIPCSPANSIQASSIYVPSFLSRPPTSLGF